jgi:hypothetical protein
MNGIIGMCPTCDMGRAAAELRKVVFERRRVNRAFRCQLSRQRGSRGDA